MSKMESLPEINNEFKYRAVVFDLDGTLYNQTKLRLNMAMRLGVYYCSHFWKIKELFVLKYFRKVRDKWEEISSVPGDGDLDSGVNYDGASTEGSADNSEVGLKGCNLDDAQYTFVARKKGVNSAYVERVVKKWIYDNPLDLLIKCRNERLYSYILDLKSAGIPVIIFSDYPISDKIAALQIVPDGMYCPGDERNIELKPSPMGLEMILMDFGLHNSEILMVGDRDVKDGEAARRADVDYVIV